jgi:hypothetical protein
MYMCELQNFAMDVYIEQTTYMHGGGIALSKVSVSSKDTYQPSPFIHLFITAFTHAMRLLLQEPE